MANFTATTTIETGRERLSASISGSYNEVIRVTQTVNNLTNFVTVASGSTTKASATLSDCKSMIIRNAGVVGAEINFVSYQGTNGTPDTTGSASFNNCLLGVGEYIYIPNWRQSGFSTDASGGDAYTLDNQVPHANMYVALNNAAAGDAQLLNGSELASGTTATSVTVDEAAYLFAGDIIRLENEICEITSISGEVITIIRGTHGSTAATHADDTAIRLPFFNANKNFTAATGGYDTVQTTSGGSFKCTNFFGYGRNTDGSGNRQSNGIVPGSISGKFYSSGFQEFNMTSIASSTNSGLVASTEYKLDITVDGGSKFQDLTITTDSSNLNFGDIISKIQSALDTQYYTAGNLFEKRVHVALVGGDLRFTSGSHLSTSAILIEDTGDSGSLIDASAVGRFPAAAKIGDPVAAALSPDTLLDDKTGVESPNIGVMFYDDGYGNIRGVCSGKIHYETGALELKGCPADAHFVVSANYGSMHSGGNKFTADASNSIYSIGARSTNSKIDTSIEILGLK